MYNVKLNYSLIFLCALILGACSENNESLRKSIYALDANMLSTGNYVIIPNQGCEGCISHAEAFVKKNIANSDSIRYIFTRIQSIKLLKIKLGNEIMSSRKMLLDTANTIEYPDKKNDIYPMIVTVHNHRITNITYQSPDSNGLTELLSGK
ncbi:hypothetical protein SAMN05518672_11496 [Chitinophaga sp. CF118]|uniref:hypothetical protein n=1 Tax=Chitinophaga sp. CF118 TaxID=1884367 RepID=UPI0008E011F8|nr:hypothetical protein [Chitinophaga sp. CF118]SFF02452.1 hypothetical protein SAMN05518672_11496 [Chitinophaga sp. CF118]